MGIRHLRDRQEVTTSLIRLAARALGETYNEWESGFDYGPCDYPPGRDNDAFWPLCTAFYRRHRRAILTVNRFSGINTAVPLFKASLPF